MIDDKKIEAAKEEIYEDKFIGCGEMVEAFKDEDAKEMFDKEDIKEAIGLGVKWGINEFIKDLWYSNTEKPKEGSNIVYIDENDEFWDIDNYNSDNFDDSFGKGWDSACRTQNIYKWCCKEDLLQKEGCQQ